MKTCRKCGLEKPYAEFPPGKHGFGRCEACERALARIRSWKSYEALQAHKDSFHRVNRDRINLVAKATVKEEEI